MKIITAPTTAPVSGAVRKYTAPDVTIVCEGEKWYLEFYIEQNGKRLRKRPSGGLNRIKDKKKRLEEFKIYQQQIISKLNGGILPSFQRSPEQRMAQRKRLSLPTQGAPKANHRPTFKDISVMPMRELIPMVISEKKLFQKKQAYESTAAQLRWFLEWLTAVGLAELPACDITRQHLTAFRNYRLSIPNSNRTVNNIMIDVNAFFSYLIKNYPEALGKHPGLGMGKLKTASETHVAFTDKEAERISLYLQETDPELLFFCKFIAYCFTRVEETTLIRVGDLLLDEGRLLVPAANIKSGKREKRIIEDIFLNELRARRTELKGYNQKHFLFGKKGIPGPEPINYLTVQRRFRKMKLALGFSEKHTMYGLKHTFISQLLENGAPWQDVMTRAGIKTMEAFEKYARSLLGGKYTYLSDKYSVKF